MTEMYRFKKDEHLQRKEKWFREEGYVAKPLAFIPQKDVEIYSRCIVFRQDYEIACRYLEK